MKIQLNVPFFSQRENNVIWDDKYDQKVAGFPLGAIQYRSCNITCLTMILHYYSKTFVQFYQLDTSKTHNSVDSSFSRPLLC